VRGCWGVGRVGAPRGRAAASAHGTSLGARGSAPPALIRGKRKDGAVVEPRGIRTPDLVNAIRHWGVIWRSHLSRVEKIETQLIQCLISIYSSHVVPRIFIQIRTFW